MFTNQSMQVSDVFRAEIDLPAIPISIPVLSEVRWIGKLAGSFYRVGMRFLL